ncbi:MAG: hypothetical protein HOD60_04650 [Candidatus Nitrosopelagicus sp.]|jgi:hypothetical protein|nr:hypothetical protein [Candidatus Nitrosopelagicus sp.]
MSRPTLAQKRKIFKFLIERDGYKCYLCEKEFSNPREPILEHLNDNWNDNREDNLALAHQSCNIKKIEDGNFQEKAHLKLEKNQLEMYVGESFLKKEQKKNLSNEIEINKKCFDIAEEYLTTNIMKNSIIDYKKTIPAIVYLCKKKINHGSVQSIRSHVQTLTSEVAPFEIIKQKKGKIIQKRAS